MKPLLRLKGFSPQAGIEHGAARLAGQSLIYWLEPAHTKFVRTLRFETNL